MKKFAVIFSIIQYIIAVLVLIGARTDIQSLPAIMMIMNATNFLILYYFIKKK